MKEDERRTAGTCHAGAFDVASADRQTVTLENLFRRAFEQEAKTQSRASRIVQEFSKHSYKVDFYLNTLPVVLPATGPSTSS